MSKQPQPQQPPEPQPQESPEHAQVRAAVEAAELQAQSLAARVAAHNSQTDIVVKAQERVDAEMALRALEWQKDRLATLERREFEQRPAQPGPFGTVPADGAINPGIFGTWMVKPPEPAHGPINPGFRDPAMIVPTPPAGSLAAYQREGFLVELFAASAADPENVAKLRSLVFELCRLVRDSDISSRSRGLPH